MNREKKDMPPRFPAFRDAFLELMGDMTLEQFAEKLGMSRATVGFYAAGQRIPDALGIKNVAEKCEVSADWLLGLSNFKKIENRTESAIELGFSEESIDCLRWIKNDEYYNEMIFTVNALLEDIKDCFYDGEWQDDPVLLSISNYLHSGTDSDDDKFYVGRNGKLFKQPDDASSCCDLADIIHVSDLVRDAYLKDIENRLFRIWLNCHYGE